MILVGETYVSGKVPVGTKLKFFNEKQAYTVRASNVAFCVCTKPLNRIKSRGGGKYEHKKTVLYTVIDWTKKVRGTENLVFGFGAETDEQCQQMLERLTQGESEISHRNNVPMNERYGVEKVIFPTNKK